MSSGPFKQGGKLRFSDVRGAAAPSSLVADPRAPIPNFASYLGTSDANFDPAPAERDSPIRARQLHTEWKAIVNAVLVGGAGFMKNFTVGVKLEGASMVQGNSFGLRKRQSVGRQIDPAA
jgi:hypothetical protein